MLYNGALMKNHSNDFLAIAAHCYTISSVRAHVVPGNLRGYTMRSESFNIETLPVKIEYTGEIRNKWRDGDTVDSWRVTISSNLGYWSTDYFTGVGLRTKPKQSWLETKPQKPSIADVLHCLFLDAEAARYNFSDWCDCFGYSDDSINALNIYRQCLDTAAHLRKYFTQDQREQIKTIIQDM